MKERDLLEPWRTQRCLELLGSPLRLKGREASRSSPGAGSAALLLALVGLFLGQAQTAHAQAQSPRTLTRHVDTLVVPGAQLGENMQGAGKEALGVYACRGGLMVPLTFQLDERNRAGTYCWDRGPQDRHLKDEDPGIDANDELVFLAEATGDRASATLLAQVKNQVALTELELRDPLDGSLAWAYLYRFAGEPASSAKTKDLARLIIRRHNEDEATYYWEGERFRFDNDLSRMNAVRATSASLAHPGTRNFRGAVNVIDSTQVRAVVSFMWVTVTRQSNEFKVKVGGYIDGPLRVVTENLIEIYLALGIWVSAPDSYVILWRNKVSMPTNARCPVNLDTSDESNYSLCVDMRKEVKGLKFFNSHNPTPVNVDGRWSRAERELDYTFPDWNCVFGPQGALLSKFVIPDFLRRLKGSKLVYLDNEYHKRDGDEVGLEFQPGAFGYHGYLMDMRGLKKGLYPGDYVVWYLPPPFEPGDQLPYLHEYDHPLEVRASPREPAPPADEKPPTK